MEKVNVFCRDEGKIEEILEYLFVSSIPFEIIGRQALVLPSNEAYRKLASYESGWFEVQKVKEFPKSCWEFGLTKRSNFFRKSIPDKFEPIEIAHQKSRVLESKIIDYFTDYLKILNLNKNKRWNKTVYIPKGSLAAIRFDEKDEAKGLSLLIKNLQAPIVGLADGIFIVENNLLKVFNDAHISYKTVKLESQDVNEIYNKFKGQGQYEHKLTYGIKGGKRK